MAKYGMSDLSSVKVASQGKNKVVTAQNAVDLVNWKECCERNNGWARIRLFGDIVCSANYWVSSVKKDGTTPTRFPVYCPSFNPMSGTREPGKYDPWWEIEQREHNDGVDNRKKTVQFQSYYYMNAIVRDEQENEPSRIRITPEEKASGFKNKGSKSWTPVQVVRLSRSLLQKIQDLKPLNSVKFKGGAIKTFDVSDVRFGRDIMVHFDDKAPPANMYTIQLGDKRTPLTEEEQKYLIHDLDLLFGESLSEAEVRADFESWAKRVGYSDHHAKIQDETEDDDGFMDDDEEAPKPAKRKVATKAPVQEVDEDDEDDIPFDSDDDSDFDEDEEPTPPKKKAKPAPAKAKNPVEDDDLEEDDLDEPSDFDEDDEFGDDEEPAPKSRSSNAKSKEVEEDDLDDFGEDEDDDVPTPPKKKAKPAPAKAKKPEPDDDLDFDDDDDF